jgi:hypothetical protein
MISFISCKKENIEYINYNSEIFSGTDTLIYGEWKYLYSSGGFSGGQVIDIGVSLLSIKPIGDYASVSKDNKIFKGKILISGQEYNHTQIQFCQDGIKTNTAFLQTIYFNGPDTLILDDGCCDLYSHYYKRIK